MSSPAEEIKLPTTVRPIGEPAKLRLSRQSIRRLGYFEILLFLKHEYSGMPRHQVREAARKLQKAAWDGRDKEAVARLVHGREHNN